MTDYDLLIEQLHALTDHETNWVADLSNASALLFESLDDLNWAGFYLVDSDRMNKNANDKEEPAPRQLVLGPFQGKPACIRIDEGKGVCGTCLKTGLVQRVDDVHRFPGHIACDSASNSEIVVPIRQHGVIVGVMDLDSPSYRRFCPGDQEGLVRFVKVLEQNLDFR